MQLLFHNYGGCRLVNIICGLSDLIILFKVGDKVQFNINQLKSTKETNAVQVRILERANKEPVPEVVETTGPAGDSPPR